VVLTTFTRRSPTRSRGRFRAGTFDERLKVKPLELEVQTVPKLFRQGSRAGRHSFCHQMAFQSTSCMGAVIPIRAR
jgi:hypothetical protein